MTSPAVAILDDLSVQIGKAMREDGGVFDGSLHEIKK
jgi:hypothetical protein